MQEDFRQKKKKKKNLIVSKQHGVELVRRGLNPVSTTSQLGDSEKVALT